MPGVCAAARVSQLPDHRRLILGGGLLDIAWWYAVCYALSILAYLGTSGRLASWIMGVELRQRIIDFVNPLRLKMREAVVPD